MEQITQINSLNNFIGAFKLQDKSLCDDLINYHKTSNLKYRGKYGVITEDSEIDTSIKDSTDCVLNHNLELLQKYYKNLQLCIDEYIKQYPWCANYASFTTLEESLVQHYKPNQGYHIYHAERIVDLYPIVSRHLVFTTYLNDVTDEGETEFLHQKLKVKPEKGLTIIFPADWTFTHRGITSKTQEKYIVTGWLNYVNN